MLSFQNLLSVNELSRADVDVILKRATQFHETSHQISEVAKGKILASLFFEPSTRTRFSFEAAMYRLGGHVVTMESSLASSIQKGETLSDMGRIMSGYCDIVTMRHAIPYSIKEFAQHATVPVINAGDGPNQHPSQSLLDAYTIKFFQKKIDHLTIGFVGDLKFGRTVNSLMQLLSLFSGITFYCISHPTLRVSPDLVATLKNSGHTVIEMDNMNDLLPELDVVYMTRVQKERFVNEKEYLEVKDHFLLTPESLVGCKSTLSILHPLPRVNEISPALDAHPAAHFFDQAKFGLFVRMALISEMLKLEK
ncbi:MAG: aspartate carbamoyltransferase [Candidatus Margulisbacteria bacterium]|nr:aspartate carbamoyltransferase [Candidatus Margulisiibacteriota bacterium]